MADASKTASRDIYAELLAARRDRFLELAESNPTVTQPDPFPSVKMGGIEGKIAYINSDSGEMLIMHSSEAERSLVHYAFRLGSGELVAFYKVQIISGADLPYAPYRIYDITYNASPSPAAKKAAAEVGIEHFARYVAANPDYSEEGGRKMKVVQAPLGEGERLL